MHADDQAGHSGRAVALRGGTANFGRVFRVRDVVCRPRGPHSDAVHRLLRHLRARGFDGAPDVVDVSRAHETLAAIGDSAADTELLGFVEGQTATEPLRRWASSDSALWNVGVLLARYHRAAAGFDGGALRWQRLVPERWRGDLVTHNDTNPTNVVFRDGRAVALIDFDLAAPGCPAWDLAITACFWVPLREPSDVPDPRRGRAVERLRLLLDAYGADSRLRSDVAEACPDANDWIAEIIREATMRGHPAFGRVWSTHAPLSARAANWLRDNRAALDTVVQ